MNTLQGNDIWQSVLGELELKLPKHAYETWLKGTEGTSFEQGVLEVTAPSPFVIECLEKKMYPLIHKTLEHVTSQPVEIRFQVVDYSTDPIKRERHAAHIKRKPEPKPASHHSLFNERYTFSNFVVGPSNHLAYSAALAVSEAPGVSYNPLFIYSGVGLGKTHLLRAIGHACTLSNQKILYVTGEQFTNEFISAIQSRTTAQFRERFRTPEVLLIDDIQFISGKEQTQEGFFHTFNALHTTGRQIILTSDRPPQALSLLEDRLRSRFEWGLISDIQAPDLETRMVILNAKAELLGYKLENHISEIIAKKVRRNVRELEGSLTRIIAIAQLTKSPVTAELVARALSHLFVKAGTQPVKPDQVLNSVCHQFAISSDELHGKRRTKTVALARQTAMYLLREELHMGFTQIGRVLGGRDHTTVIHAVGNISYKINVDPELHQRVLAIKEDLFTSPSSASVSA